MGLSLYLSDTLEFLKMRLKPLLIAEVAIAVLVIAFLHLEYGVFTRYNYLTAQWDKVHGEIRLLTYGKELTVANQRAIIAKRMGFDIITIAGCEIGSSLANGADQYNNVMSTTLYEKMGKHWKVTFDKSVDSLFRMQSSDRIQQAIMALPDVEELFRKTASVKNGKVFVRIVDLADTDIMHPNVELCQEREMGYVIFQYYRVDPYTLRTARIYY